MSRKKKEEVSRIKVAYIKNSLESIGPIEEFEYSGKTYLRVQIPIGWIVKGGDFYFLDLPHDIRKITPDVVEKYKLHDYFVVGYGS